MLDAVVKKIKDIIYDINDVIIVLVILACAVLLIVNRIEIIMAYPMNGDPSVIIAEAPGDDHLKTIGDGSVSDYNKDSDGGENGQGDGSVDGQDDGSQTPDMNPSQTGEGQSPEPAATEQPTGDAPYSLYVAYGETAGQIAQKLLDAGIISNKDDFYDAIIAAKAERKLLAGSFIIPKNSTMAEVVTILTGG